MRFKTIVFFLIGGILFLVFSFTRLYAPIDKISLLLEQFEQKFPQEKVHLHIDRNYFATGDTLHFQAYVVNSDKNQFSTLSKILYVDLLNVDNSSRTTLRFPLEEGTASGTIEFPDTLKEGTYILQAYTNWMRNFDKDFFYHTILKIGSVADSRSNIKKEIPILKRTFHEAQFFPEGGNLVDGLTSVVGFKVTGPDGLGEEVSGTVVDGSGQVLTSFRSAFTGMGRLILKPLAGHNYTALVKFKDGTIQKFALPRSSSSGCILTVNNQENNNVFIQVKQSGQQLAGPVYLVAQANNKLISITEINTVGNSATLSIPRRKLPSGIVQLTLFDKFSDPKAERMIFINRYDQLRLNLSIPKMTSGSPKVKITLEVTDELSNPVSGGFSVAVLNQSTTTDSSIRMPSILSDLLLTSDLKGNVEFPDYYFRDKSPETSLNLDNLMLTQGWRRFVWKDILAEKFPELIYKVEKNLSLSGRAESRGLPVPNLRLSMVSKGGKAFTLDTITDSKGRFAFDLPDLVGQQQFMVVASTKGNKDVKILFDHNPQPNAAGSPIPVSPSGLDNQLLNYLAVKRQYPTDRVQIFTGQPHQIKEVEVKSKKLTLTEKAVAASANLNGPGNADQIITYKDLNNCKDLEICLQGKLNGVFFKTVIDPNSHSYKKVPFSISGMDKPMLLVIDGVAIPSNQASLNSIPAVNVQSIEVLRTGSKLVVYGMEASGGVLVITTKKGGIDYEGINEPLKIMGNVPGVFYVTYDGYHKSREFYIPPMDQTFMKKSKSPETIFWKPLVQTNDEGKELVEFPVGINVKKIAVVVEGLSADGKIGYKYEEKVIR